MKHGTHEITAQTFQGWQLDSIIDEMLAGDSPDGSAKASRCLIKSKELTVVLTALHQGQELREHHVAASILVVPLRGEVVFTHEGSQTSVATEGCQILALGRGQGHTARALTDSAFLLVLGTLHHEHQP